MIFFGTQNLVQEYIFQSKFNTGPGLFVFFPMAYLARLIFQQLLFFSSICLTPSPFHTQKQMVRPFSGSTGACNRVGQRWLQAWSPPF